MTCQSCDGRGLIRVMYTSGETFDLAICACPDGQPYRIAASRALVHARLQLEDDGARQVGYVEDFDTALTAPPRQIESFITAGRTRQKAKL